MDNDGRMTDVATLVCVAPDMAGKVLPIVHGMLDAGFAAADEVMPGDLLERLERCRQLLWLVLDAEGKPIAVMLTQLVVMRSGLCCRLSTVAGSDMESWSHLHEKIEEYARAEGCVKILLGDTRDGWKRVLPGYEKTGITLEKVLS